MMAFRRILALPLASSLISQTQAFAANSCLTSISIKSVAMSSDVSMDMQKVSAAPISVSCITMSESSTSHRNNDSACKVRKLTASIAAIISTALPVAAMAYDGACDGLNQASSLESSSFLLNTGEISEALQLVYTTALVAGVGYTQRMAGREDFKKEMAMKIAKGEITPEKLVNEIKDMAYEINKSADVAFSAQLEVQKLLEETKALQQRLQLPSAIMSTLPEFHNNEAEQKEEERAVLPIYVDKSYPSNHSFRPPLLALDVGNDVMLSRVESTLYHNDMETNFDHRASVDIFDDEAVLSMDGINEEIADEESEIIPIEDDTIKIAQALLAKPPSLRSDNKDTLDVSFAFKLAQEAFTSASSEKMQTVSSDSHKDIFLPPMPPLEEPPLDLVLAGLEFATSTGFQPEMIEVKQHKTEPTPKGPIRSSPLARLLCAELGVKLEDVYPGTGLKGRIIATDVREYAAMREKVKV